MIVGMIGVRVNDVIGWMTVLIVVRKGSEVGDGQCDTETDPDSRRQCRHHHHVKCCLFCFFLFVCLFASRKLVVFHT